MNFDSIDISDRVGEESARLASKLVLAAGSVAFVAYLLTLLPGIDRRIPQTSVTFAALFGAIATGVVVVLVLYAAPRIALLVRLHLAGPREVVDEIAAVVNWTVVLAAILIAHRGFAGLVVPLLDGAAWRYDVAFLVIAFPVVGFVAVHLYRGLDPSADHLGARIAAAERSDSSDEDGNGGSPSADGGTAVADATDEASAAEEPTTN